MAEVLMDQIKFIKIYQKRPFDGDEPLSLSPGEACYLNRRDEEPTLTLACPKCGQEMSISDHKIIWLTSDMVTVDPSILHDMTVPDTGFFGPGELMSGKVKEEIKKQEPKPCGAHFRIIKNEIVWIQ